VSSKASIVKVVSSPDDFQFSMGRALFGTQGATLFDDDESLVWTLHPPVMLRTGSTELFVEDGALETAALTIANVTDAALTIGLGYGDTRITPDFTAGGLALLTVAVPPPVMLSAPQTVFAGVTPGSTASVTVIINNFAINNLRTEPSRCASTAS